MKIFIPYSKDENLVITVTFRFLNEKLKVLTLPSQFLFSFTGNFLHVQLHVYSIPLGWELQTKYYKPSPLPSNHATFPFEASGISFSLHKYQNLPSCAFLISNFILSILLLCLAVVLTFLVGSADFCFLLFRFFFLETGFCL